MNNNENENDEIFSDDPQKHLRIENELLRLKMIAQFGSDIEIFSNEEMTPETENYFLNQIYEAQEQFHNSTFLTMIEKVGIDKPAPSEGMTLEAITEALCILEATLATHGIFLERRYGPYPDKEIYDFIVNELLALDVDIIPPGAVNIGHEGEEYDEEEYDEEEDDAEEEALLEQSINRLLIRYPNGDVDNDYVDGFHYIYEEFHPNNKYAIENLVYVFMEHWQHQYFEDNDKVFCPELVVEKGRRISRTVLYRKLQQFFDAFLAFENFEFQIDDIQFTVQGDNSFIGNSVGSFTYDAIMENEEKTQYKGSFKLFMIREKNNWRIVNFYMPGFTWDGQSD